MSADIVWLAVSALALGALALSWSRPPSTTGSVSDGPQWFAAHQRAERLLAENLSERERLQLQRCGYIELVSPTVRGRTYRVPARPGMVEVYEYGEPAMRLCVQPAVALPQPDVVLMHKLLIEGDEQTYLRTANRLPLSRAASSRSRYGTVGG